MRSAWKSHVHGNDPLENLWLSPSLTLSFVGISSFSVTLKSAEKPQFWPCCDKRSKSKKAEIERSSRSSPSPFQSLKAKTRVASKSLFIHCLLHFISATLELSFCLIFASLSFQVKWSQLDHEETFNAHSAQHSLSTRAEKCWATNRNDFWSHGLQQSQCESSHEGEQELCAKTRL